MGLVLRVDGEMWHREVLWLEIRGVRLNIVKGEEGWLAPKVWGVVVLQASEG